MCTVLSIKILRFGEEVVLYLGSGGATHVGSIPIIRTNP
jgi:hypothetical protein